MPVIVSLAPEEEEEMPKPSWAHNYEKEQAAAARQLKGTVVKWNVAAGWGFITRADGLGDIFVHQRHVKKKGFRSLLEGEAVEFEVQAGTGAGKLEAVHVTGPAGAEVIGQPEPDRRKDDSDSDTEGKPRKSRTKGDEPTAPPPPSVTSKASTAFMPRNLKRPGAPSGGGRSIPLPKAKAMKATALSDVTAAQVAAAAGSAPGASSVNGTVSSKPT